jgi:hypothetical protein
MTYLLLDPPVNPLSPREKIETWIGRLEALAREPQYDEEQPREAIQSALREARAWLADDASEASSPITASEPL